MNAIILGPVIPDEDAAPTNAGLIPKNDGVGGILNASYVALAREIALGITPMETLAITYGFKGLSDPRWTDVIEHHEFQRVLAESVREWQSADGTPKRVRIKSAAIVEANLPEIHSIIASPQIPAIQRVEAFKAMARLAGMGDGAANPANKGGGSGFSVTINIGKGQQVRLAAKPENVIDHDDGVGATVLENDSISASESPADFALRAIAGG